MSNWDPCGENSVPDETRSRIAGEYEESETEIAPISKGRPAGCAVIILATLTFWALVAIKIKSCL